MPISIKLLYACADLIWLQDKIIIYFGSVKYCCVEVSFRLASSPPDEAFVGKYTTSYRCQDVNRGEKEMCGWIREARLRLAMYTIHKYTKS